MSDPPVTVTVVRTNGDTLTGEFAAGIKAAVFAALTTAELWDEPVRSITFKQPRKDQP